MGGLPVLVRLVLQFWGILPVHGDALIGVRRSLVNTGQFPVPFRRSMVGVLRTMRCFLGAVTRQFR